MNRNTRVPFVAFTLLVSLLVAAQSEAAKSTASSSDVAFRKLVEADWQWRLKDEPLTATSVGDDRYNALLPDLSKAAQTSRDQYLRSRLESVKAINRVRLSEAERLNYDLFLAESELDVEGLRFPREYLLVSQMGGPHSLLSEVALEMPKRRVKDWEDLLSRMRAFPRYLDDATVWLREGVEKGITQPRIVLESLPGQIEGELAAKPEDTSVYRLAFAQFPESARVPKAEAARLRQEAREVLSKDVLPSIRKFLAFVKNDYVPRARTTLGCTDLPDGEAWYAHRIRAQTSLSKTPAEIHDVGLAEVERIRGELDALRKSAKFDGTLAAYLKHMRTDKRYTPTSKEQLMLRYRDLAKRIDPELPKLFRELPRLPYGVVAMPEHREKTAPAAYYQPGSPEAGRAGTFQVNTFNLKERPVWEMEPLTLHESVPGHHLQIALAQELPTVPAFRRYGGYNAFVEGWGLYAESLGEELGLYRDDAARFGKLTFEMWRAIRLVVDTGMHARGWSREKAIAYFTDNAGKSEHDIRIEIDRYIAWPGQALGYKLGELEIKALRKSAETELGDAFDVRDFHAEVLGEGPLPLPLLRERIESWVKTTKAAAQKKATAPATKSR